jgi:hypothetical protein
MKLRILALAGLLAVASLFPCCTMPSWVSEAETIAKVALPIVEGIAGVVGAGPAVTQVVNDIELIISLLDQYQATPAAGTLAQIQAALNTVNADIAQILPAAHIQNAATQSKVEAILQLVSSEFSSIASLLPASAAGPSATGAKPAIANPAGKLPFTAKQFKSQYNKIVLAKTGDAQCDQAFQGKELK